MAQLTLHSITFLSLPFHFPRKPISLSPKPNFTPPIQNPLVLRNRVSKNMHSSRVSSFQDAFGGAVAIVQSSPATWESSLLSNLLIFVLGSPILVTGLSFSGIVAAFLLGTLTWRAFGSHGFLLVAAFFIIGTAATKVKITQKMEEGVAEKKRGRRGPESVIGSSAAGCICSLLAISGVGGAAFSQLWRLGFVASFCTKLSDTVSSEIGKAYGKTTYLVTTFKIVPRGTEGAISVEGTLAGIFAALILAFLSFLLGEIGLHEVVICLLASQIANLGESLIGALLQDKKGFEWLNNDLVNVINISIGSITAVLMQQALQNWTP